MRELNEQGQALCECGTCGLPAPIAKLTNRKLGHVKGQPVRFISGHSTRLRYKPSTERFWGSVDCTSTPDGCWPFTGTVSEDGYGQIQFNGRQRMVHHIALELAGWIIPCEWLETLHLCDNPPCCNPAHLRIGTKHDNVADKVSKGRQARGERNGRAVLDPDKAAEIRALYLRGVRGRSIRALAERFSVSPATIDHIIRGEIWNS